MTIAVDRTKEARAGCIDTNQLAVSIDRLRDLLAAVDTSDMDGALDERDLSYAILILEHTYREVTTS